MSAAPQTTSSTQIREFNLSNQQFEQFRVLARDIIGINLSEAKRELVYSRLVRRLRQLELDNFSDYIALLEQRSATETRTIYQCIDNESNIVLS